MTDSPLIEVSKSKVYGPFLSLICSKYNVVFVKSLYTAVDSITVNILDPEVFNDRVVAIKTLVVKMVAEFLLVELTNSVFIEAKARVSLIKFVGSYFEALDESKDCEAFSTELNRALVSFNESWPGTAKEKKRATDKLYKWILFDKLLNKATKGMSERLGVIETTDELFYKYGRN